MTIKVNSNVSTPKQQKLSPDEIKQKIARKFGKEAEIKKAEPKAKTVDQVEINSKDTVAHGDIGKNDPASEITKEKLRGILQAGAFNFNDKERSALGQILK